MSTDGLAGGPATDDGFPVIFRHSFIRQPEGTYALQASSLGVYYGAVKTASFEYLV